MALDDVAFSKVASLLRFDGHLALLYAYQDVESDELLQKIVTVIRKYYPQFWYEAMRKRIQPIIDSFPDSFTQPELKTYQVVFQRAKETLVRVPQTYSWFQGLSSDTQAALVQDLTQAVANRCYFFAVQVLQYHC